MAKSYMNPSYGQHMAPLAETEKDRGDKEEGERLTSEGSSAPSHVLVHSHSRGHTVHVMGDDGSHEKYDYDDGDGVTAKLSEYFGGAKKVGAGRMARAEKSKSGGFQSEAGKESGY